MLQVDDLERLSRFQAGELTAAEADAVRAELAARPELRAALARLERLDAVARALAAAPAGPPTPADDAAIAAAVARSTGPGASGRPWAVPVALAAAVAAAVLTWALAARPAEHDAALTRARVLPEAVTVANGRATPLEGAVVEREGDALSLKRGTALVEGAGVAVRCDAHAFEVNGRALASTEPEAAVLHVTGTADFGARGDDMNRLKAQWTKNPPATAGMAVLLAVLSGQAMADGKVLPAGAVFTAPRSEVRQAVPAPAAAPTPAGPAKPGPDAEKSPRKLMLLEGMLPYAPMREALRGIGPELAKCFEKGRAQSPGLQGDVTLLVTVVPAAVGGRAEDVQVEGYTLQHPFVTACVVEAVGKVSFPAPTTAKAKLVIPLDFQGRGDGSTDAVQVRVAAPEGEPATLHMPDRQERVEVRTAGAVPAGPGRGQVTVVAFIDFECTFCQRSWATVGQLMQQYAGKVNFVFLQRPLPFHPGARAAAEAAVAAGQQGRFREYADLLFAEQKMHDAAGLDALARRAGLDLQRFRQALADGTAADEVKAHLAEADRLGARGTPTFFINGRELVGARPLATFQQMIDEELGAAK